MKLIYPVFLSSNIVADNIMQTHQWQVLAENQKIRVRHTRHAESHHATHLPLGSQKPAPLTPCLLTKSMLY